MNLSLFLSQACIFLRDPTHFVSIEIWNNRGQFSKKARIFQSHGWLSSKDIVNIYNMVHRHGGLCALHRRHSETRPRRESDLDLWPVRASGRQDVEFITAYSSWSRLAWCPPPQSLIWLRISYGMLREMEGRRMRWIIQRFHHWYLINVIYRAASYLPLLADISAPLTLSSLRRNLSREILQQENQRTKHSRFIREREKVVLENDRDWKLLV